MIDPKLAKIWQSNYGRAEGWDVERHGEVIARLKDPRWPDQFWFNYELVICTQDATLAKRMLTDDFWNQEADLRLRSIATGDYVDTWIIAGQPFIEPGRLNFRGLHVAARSPSKSERSQLNLGY